MQKRKKMRGLVGGLLCLLLIHSTVLSTSAAQLSGEGTDTYSIRIYTGQQGIMTECSGGNGRITEDGRTFVLNGVSYKERISISYALQEKNDSQYNYFVLTVRQGENNDPGRTTTIQLRTESKYNVIGSRISGRDNSERIGSEIIESDRDYVIAYGLMKDAVEYTIRYVDTAGNSLRQNDRYYGSVGDKPVVSYQYIDGYQPQAYNLTKTLSENAVDNVFTFVYSRIQIPGVNTTTRPGTSQGSSGGTSGGGTTTVISGGATGGSGGGTGGNTGGGTNVGGQGGAGGEEPGGGAANNGEDTGNGEGEGQETIPDEPVPLGPPQETIDLDDEEVPLAEYKSGDNRLISVLSGNASLVSIPLYLKILAVCIFATILGVGIWLILKARKKKEEDEKNPGGPV